MYTLWLHVCGSIVANPIIYTLVPSPSRFEIRQWRLHTTLCKSVRNISTIISTLGQRTQLKLRELSSLEHPRHLKSRVPPLGAIRPWRVFISNTYCVTSVKRPTLQTPGRITWQSVGDRCSSRCVLVVCEAFCSDLRSTMWIIFEIFVVFFKIFICYIEAVFRAIVRPSKKDIQGQTVLITGKTNASYTIYILQSTSCINLPDLAMGTATKQL